MNQQLSAGKEVLSICNKCDLSLAHTIVTMKDDKLPGKVECKTCKSTHNYKDPTASTKKKAKKTRKRKSAATVLAEETAAANATLWQKTVKNLKGKEVRAYTISEEFAPGEMLEHKKFGLGLVDSISDNNKIEVIFEKDLKTLMHKTKN